MARALPFDAAIVDIMMPGLDGIATLDELKRIDEDLAVIIITAYASVESAISAMKAGAFDYITKPFKNDEVLVVVRNAMERRRLVSENRNLRQNIQERYHKFANIIGRSPRMRQVFDLIIQAAPSRSTILIQGESGTGKELVARAIHSHSARAKKAFVKVSVGAVPDRMIESEVFGHEKGAFAGATSSKRGSLELACGGTLFLDEVGELSGSAQTRFLRLLREGRFARLGGTETLSADVRILAASTTDLEAAVAAQEFREDLHRRLSASAVFLPPLRERGSDVLLLAEHFFARYSRAHGKRIRRISTAAMDMLASHPWPGNVRELENTIERAVLSCESSVLHGHHLPPALQVAKAPETSTRASLSEAVQQYEKDLILDALKSARGNRMHAARLLDTTERVIGYKIHKYGIEPQRFRAPGLASR